jgi:hypothetical protein
MNHVESIVAAIPEADYPPVLRDALAFKAATAALVAAAAAEKPVDLTTATTPRNVAKVLDAAVAFDVGHDLRVQHANTLARIAVERLEAAQQVAASAAEARFVIEFDAAANRLYELVAKLGGVDPEVADSGGWPFNPHWTDLRAVLADLERLGNLRDDYVYRSGGGQLAFTPCSIPYERHSRTAYLADAAASNYLEQHTRGPGPHSPRYWLVAAAAPGVKICWQNATQQNAQPAPAQITRRDDALRATTAAREATYAAHRSA